MMASSQAFQNLIVSVGAGERIFSEGEIGTTMFIVQSGRVLLFRESGGTRSPIAEMEKGDFFGEMSLLEGTPRNMFAEAIDACELIEINSTTFDRMIRSNVEIAVRLLRKLSGRLQKAEALIMAQRAALEAPQAPVAGRQMRVAPLQGPVSPQLRPGVGSPGGRPAPAAGHPSTLQAAAQRPPADTSAKSAAPARPVAPSPTGSLSATRPPSPSMQQALRDSGALRAARVAPPRAAVQGPRLVSEAGDTVFPLITNEAIVGRYDPVTETQPEVDLTLLDIKRSVSRRHARITLQEGSFYLIEEVGALNGTYINGAKLVTGKAAPLKDADRVSMGTVNLVFRA